MNELDEIFFANGDVEVEDRKEGDPIIWKTVLSQGRLELTPGPYGTKVKKPLVIVEGRSSDPNEEIGLQDLLDSYEAGAIQHVTVPTSHSNTLLENTGFIRGMRIAEENGRKVLKAGFEFKDPDVLNKVKQGTIADVSCGILKGYERQRDGRKFNAVVDHIALTNKPWVDGMTPFAQFADEVDTQGFYFAEQEVDLAVYNQSSNVPFDYTSHGVIDVSDDNSTTTSKWDIDQGMLIRQHRIEDALDEEYPDCMLVDFTSSRILVDSDNGTKYVIGYNNGDGKINFHPREEWIEFTPQTGLSEDHNKEMEGGKDPMDEVLLAEKTALEEELAAARAEIAEKNSRLESAARKEREVAIKERVRELGALGLSDYPGFMGVVEEIMLADAGVNTLNLSEDQDGITASDVVERLIAALPKKDDKIVLSEQATLLENDVKPADVEKPKTVEERAAVAREFLGLNQKKTVLS